MNQDGNSFNQTPAGGSAATPFRPYFVAASTQGAKKRVAERIVFSMNEDTSFTFDDNDPSEEEADGALRFYTKKHLIGVESSLNKETDVLIVNTNGLPIGKFTIQPGETIETPAPMSGVYILRAARGKYNKKILVK